MAKLEKNGQVELVPSGGGSGPPTGCWNQPTTKALLLTFTSDG